MVEGRIGQLSLVLNGPYTKSRGTMTSVPSFATRLLDYRVSYSPSMAYFGQNSSEPLCFAIWLKSFVSPMSRGSTGLFSCAPRLSVDIKCTLALNPEAEFSSCRYDLAFVDADKRSYLAYFECLLKLVSLGQPAQRPCLEHS